MAQKAINKQLDLQDPSVPSPESSPKIQQIRQTIKNKSILIDFDKQTTASKENN